MFFKKLHRKEIITLNVVALIDVSSILIIFLIMGAIFGESAVIPPPEIEMPRSSNKDTVMNAPQVSIMKDAVRVSISPLDIPLSAFRESDVDSKEIKELKTQIQKYLKEMPADLKKSGTLVNVVADRRSPYQDIFDVVSFFRIAGFESILFIAQGD